MKTVRGASPRDRNRSRTGLLGARASLPARAPDAPPLLAGWKPALVWSAPHLQGGSGAGKQVQLHTCIRPLWWELFGSRALMGSAHTSPHLPDGLERAQRGLRLVACRSDLSCHRLHFPSQRLASSCSPRWLALGGPVRSWYGACGGHAAISTGCPRARGPSLAQAPVGRRWISRPRSWLLCPAAQGRPTPAPRGIRARAPAAPRRYARSCSPTPPPRCSLRGALAPTPPSGCAGPRAWPPPATPLAPRE